jgi:hypothetical protein
MLSIVLLYCIGGVCLWACSSSMPVGYHGSDSREASSSDHGCGMVLGYRIPNGSGKIGGTRHDPKKHGPSSTLGTINRA